MKQTIQICTSEKARSPLPIWIGQLYVCLLVNFARDPGRVKTMGTRLCSSQFAKQHLGHVIKSSFVVKQILANCSWKFDDFFRISNINKIKMNRTWRKPLWSDSYENYSITLLGHFKFLFFSSSYEQKLQRINFVRRKLTLLSIKHQQRFMQTPKRYDQSNLLSKMWLRTTSISKVHNWMMTCRQSYKQ